MVNQVIIKLFIQAYQSIKESKTSTSSIEKTNDVRHTLLEKKMKIHHLPTQVQSKK